MHMILTHISQASFLWDIVKQNSPRCDATKRGILFAILFSSTNEKLLLMPLKIKWTHQIDKDAKVHSAFQG